jgi:hypothetical protein
MAGLEARLGTKSMYMRRNVADLRRRGLSHGDALHGYIKAPVCAQAIGISEISVSSRQNFGLVIVYELTQIIRSHAMARSITAL